MIYLYCCLILYFLSLNVVTTIRLWHSDSYSKSQKIVQTAIIWLLPVIGVLIVILFLNTEPLQESNPSFLRKLYMLIFFIKNEKEVKKKKHTNDMSGGEVYDSGNSGFGSFGGFDFGGGGD